MSRNLCTHTPRRIYYHLHIVQFTPRIKEQQITGHARGAVGPDVPVSWLSCLSGSHAGHIGVCHCSDWVIDAEPAPVSVLPRVGCIQSHVEGPHVSQWRRTRTCACELTLACTPMCKLCVVTCAKAACRLGAMKTIAVRLTLDYGRCPPSPPPPSPAGGRGKF